MYVIQTVARSEHKLKSFLENSILNEGESVWIPMKPRLLKSNGVWIEIEEILLPGYLLLTTKDPWGFRKRYYNYQSDVSMYLVGRNHLPNKPNEEPRKPDHFAQIKPEELELIELLCSGTSKGVKEGSRVEIISGPLVGMEALITYIDRHHRFARMRLPMFGREVDITVSLEVVGARTHMANKTGVSQADTDVVKTAETKNAENNAAEVKTAETEAPKTSKTDVVEKSVAREMKSAASVTKPKRKRGKRTAEPYPASFTEVDYAGIIDGDYRDGDYRGDKSSDDRE